MTKPHTKRRRSAQKRLTAVRLALDADAQTLERMIAAAKGEKPKEQRESK
ncbi:MAG TPA: hypothetical protein VKA60_23495 [Blastocatellia bacterium]|nr:hypothetical protein [Blastocatellia bacterium]